MAFVAESVREANDSRTDGQEDVAPAAVNPDGTPIAGPSANGTSGEETVKRAKKVGPAFLGRGKDSELVVDGKGERVRRKDVISKADTAWDRTVYAVSCRAHLFLCESNRLTTSFTLVGRLWDPRSIDDDDTGRDRRVVRAVCAHHGRQVPERAGSIRRKGTRGFQGESALARWAGE